MATGSGTGTPAKAGAAFTLSDLRDRIRVQLMNAGGFAEPLVLTASTETLATLRDRVELKLQDSGNATWSTDDIDEALEEALEQYSRRNPNTAIADVTLAADGREVDISSISDLLRVEKVWWPYDSTTPGHPPAWVQFIVWPGDILYIDEPTAPTSGQHVRVWYTKSHTLNGLNAAGATTVPAEDITYLVSGGAHFAAQMRAVELAEQATVDRDVVKRLTEWAKEQGKNFRYGIRLRPPAWQRYGYAHDQDDIDEAIRWALGRYNEVNPESVITTVTLSADGREVDISSITDYADVIQVWTPYTSSSPENPPNWREFELWPGDLLHIPHGSEPQSSDVVRIWYDRLCTINGLDSASTTTLPEQDQELIIAGASGFAAQERVQDQPGRSVPRKLREWAHARLREFERGLRQLARRHATRDSGTAEMAALDRWDDKDDGW